MKSSTKFNFSNQIIIEIRNRKKNYFNGDPLQTIPDGSVSKESTCNIGDLGSTPGLRRIPGEGNGNPFHYSFLDNPMDRGSW